MPSKGDLGIDRLSKARGKILWFPEVLTDRALAKKETCWRVAQSIQGAVEEIPNFWYAPLFGIVLAVIDWIIPTVLRLKVT